MLIDIDIDIDSDIMAVHASSYRLLYGLSAISCRR
jgi:hypothetical protein